MPRRQHGVVVAAVGLLVAAGAAGHYTGQPGSVNPAGRYDREATRMLRSGLGCGKERWAVKTLTDPDAGKVDFHPVAASLHDLAAMAVPAGADGPVRTAAEERTFTVTATLTGFKEEADSDYHLVLEDAGETMIAEIPAPGCATGSVAAADISRARSFFEALHDPSSACFGCLHDRVTVTGVLFFDRLHGQTGVAPNGVELHPVLWFAQEGAEPPIQSPVPAAGPTGPVTPGVTGPSVLPVEPDGDEGSR